MFMNTIDNRANPKAYHKLVSYPGCSQEKLVMNGLGTRLTTSMPRKRSLRSVYTKEKYLCNKLGLKRGEGNCSKGAYFRELTVYIYQRNSVVKLTSVGVDHARHN